MYNDIIYMKNDFFGGNKMGYLMKKKQVLNALENLQLRELFEVTNENSSGVLIQCEQTMGSGRCVISLELEDRVFNCIYFCIGKLNNIIKKDNMLELLNKFNEENVMLKFYLDHNNSIMAMITYIAGDNTFNGDEYVSLIVRAFKCIEEDYYSKIMRVLWA